MLSNSITHINQDLKRTKKAIVAIGCSFVQGAELNISCPKGADENEYKNSRTFVNKLCSKYFKNSYTPINFGQEAAGNFAAISRLFLYNIPWSSLDEIIVIFMPTGMQRLDIIKDDNTCIVGQEFKTLYPLVSEPASHFTNFQLGYEKTCYSEKFEVLNAILNFQFLNSWVAVNKAKLLVFPAFTKEYNKDYFLKSLNSSITRNKKWEVTSTTDNLITDFDFDFLVNQVPWDKFLTIDQSKTFFDLSFKNDSCYRSDLDILQVIDNNILLNNQWIMPRGHPSERGHDLMARKLFEKINAG
jgi:hypothetical protein